MTRPTPGRRLCRAPGPLWRKEIVVVAKLAQPSREVAIAACTGPYKRETLALATTSRATNPLSRAHRWAACQVSERADQCDKGRRSRKMPAAPLSTDADRASRRAEAAGCSPGYGTARRRMAYTLRWAKSMACAMKAVACHRDVFFSPPTERCSQPKRRNADVSMRLSVAEWQTSLDACSKHR